MQFYSGLNYFWVIENNSIMTNAMDKINLKNKAKSISTYDFSTLYTKIPHDKLLQSLQFFIDLVFNDKDRKYLSCTRSGAHWVTGVKGGGCRYSKDDVTEALRFLIENSFFEVGGKLFRQKIGITIGLDPAPFLANLFLAYYEIHWIKYL